MFSLKDLKRSLALILLSALLLSGMDLTAFADTGGVPRIESDLDVAVVYYDDSEYCPFNTTTRLTIPMDFSECDNISDYSKSNITEVKFTAGDLEYSGGYSLKDYLSLGYYSVTLDSYSSPFQKLFEQYATVNGVDYYSSGYNIKQPLAEEFFNMDFQVTIFYNIDGNIVELNTDINIETKDNIDGLSRYDFDRLIRNYDGSVCYTNGYTSDGYVISVPTSKTVKSSDFYQDNNAIFAVSENDNYNTYYADINSDSNINIPLDDMSCDTDLVRVKFGDNIVYDTKYSLKLNGASENLDASSFTGNTYNLSSTDKLYISNPYDSSLRVSGNTLVYDYNNFSDVLHSWLKTDFINYNGEKLDLSQSKDNVNLVDVINEGTIDYPSSSTGLIGHEDEYIGETYSYSNPLEDRYNSDYKYSTVIQLKKGETISNFPESDFKYSDTYINDSYNIYSPVSSTNYDYDNDYKVKEFYSKKNISIDNYDISEVYGLDMELVASKDTGDFKGFIKIPSDSDKFDSFMKNLYLYATNTSNVSYSDMHKCFAVYLNNNYRDDNYKNHKVLGGFMSITYNGYGSSPEEKHDYFNQDGYFYLAYNPKISGLEDKFLEIFNESFGTGFSDIADLCNSETYRVKGYSFTTSSSYYPSSTFVDYSIFGSSSSSSYNNVSSFIYDSTSKVLTTFVPDFAISIWAYEDIINRNSYSRDYFESTISSIKSDDAVYKYTCDSYNDCLTFSQLNDLGITTSDLHDFNRMKSKGHKSYSSLNTQSLNKLSDLNGKFTTKIVLNKSLFSGCYDSSKYLDDIKIVISELESNGFEIDYANSYMPDFNSVSYSIKDYINIKEYDGSNIFINRNQDAYDTEKYVMTGAVANFATSISTDGYVETQAIVSKNKISIPISNSGTSSRMSLFGLGRNSSGSGFAKGELQDISIQVIDTYCYSIPTTDVKNVQQANMVKLYDKNNVLSAGSYDDLDLDDDTSLISKTYPWGDGGYFSTYVDYKFGNIIFASKPSAPLDLTLEGDKLTWVKPIDEGLGYTVNTRSSKMSIRSVNPSFTSKTDDVVHLESYTLEIKDSSDVVKYTQTLTDSGSGLEEEITIPSQYLTSEYTAYIYATNKIGASDSASINLGVPSAKVTISTDKESYKVGDTIIYTETIKNTSSSNDLTNVKVTQSLTGGTYEDQTGVTTTDNVATISTLGKGDSVTLTYKYVVPAGVVSGDIISNKVTVTSDEGVNTYIIKEVTIADGIKDLSLDVTTDKSSYKPGDTVILKSSVKNTGEVDLTNVKITQQLDGEYIPKSGVIMSGKDASILTLAVGETVEVEYKIIIPSNYNQTSMSNKTDVTVDSGVDKSVTKTITIVLPTPTDRPYIPPVVVPTPKPTEAPTAEPTKVPTEAPTKAPTAEPTKVPTDAPTQEPTQAPTEAPTEAPTAEPTKAPTPVPEYDFTIKDVYHNDDGTTEVKERENVRIKEGEHYSFSALDSDDYIPRVPKYEGIASKDTEIIFDYDEKEKRVTLQGYVTYSDGSPIKDKLIEISGKENKSDITDDTGFYRIDNILVGDYDYTLYNDVTTGSGILAKCGITVTKKGGTVEVKYNSDDCKVDYVTEDGVIRVNANIKKEEVATPSPTPTAEPTLAPTQEPTLAPTIEPTVEPTVKPTKKPTPVSTKKPTSTPKPTKKPVAPIKVSTPEPTKKPVRVTYLAQTGIYDIKKVVSAGVLIISGLGLVIIALRHRKK